MLADADSSSACGGSRIGFANPALYRAASSAYGSYFHDVASGNNDFTGTNGGRYPAGNGYDMATGLGTPNAGALASALCADALQVGNPGTQVSTVGQPVSVQVTTNAPAGSKPSFSASGLPSGLSISKSSGRITGRPGRIGSSSVEIAAVERGVVLRGAFFTWRVVGAPTVSQVSLSGVGSGHPGLALTITAGKQAPQLSAATIGLPTGLSFAQIAHNVRVTGQSGKRVAFSAQLIRGRLQITLARPAQKVRIVVGGAAIKATGGLAANARRHRTGALTVSIKTTDASDHIAATSARITPRG